MEIGQAVAEPTLIQQFKVQTDIVWQNLLAASYYHG
jgi:hypothetical protein